MTKKANIFVIALLAVGVLSHACKKEEVVTAPDPATLKVTINQVLSNAQHKGMPKAKLQLFKSQSDFDARTNAVKDVVMDNYGKFTFTDLEPINYLFRAQSADGMMTNDKTGNQTGVLESSKTKDLEIILR
jgi:hypothetical protein